MFRVMLIDDEPLALEGLETLIDWAKQGFSVAAKCRDGSDAITKIDSAAPDLIVTDIYMPGMDGIALMAHLRARGYDGEFLIVSGYGEFEKAREALRMGASGYILKPVDSDEAASAISTARDRIILKKLKSESAERAPEYRRALTSALSGEKFDADALPRGGEWRLLTWGSALPIEYAAAMHESVKRERAAACILVLDEREIMVAHSFGNAKNAVATVVTIAERAGREVVCESADSPEGLKAAYERVCAALDLKWERVADKVNDMERLTALRQHADYRQLCDDILQSCRSQGGFAESRINDLWYARCVRLLENAPEKLSAFMREFPNRRDIIETGLAVMALLAPDESRLSDTVILILRERYSENITLDGLAASLGYNPAYLGRVFRDETGMTFRAWLADFRMKEAAKLLTETDRSAQAIAVSVGFHKYSNFLEHFKLAFGMTPDSYRRARRPNVSP